jgi:hypothetical protein
MELVFIVRDQEVEGSNPFAPTIPRALRICLRRCYLVDAEAMWKH